MADLLGDIYLLKIGGVFKREGHIYAILEGQLCFEFCLFLLGGGQEFTKVKKRDRYARMWIFFMGDSKIFQRCKNMELWENQEQTNRNKTTRKRRNGIAVPRQESSRV